jgi:hypothetical protein
MTPTETKRDKNFTSISIRTPTVNQIKSQIVRESISRLRDVADGTSTDYSLNFSVAGYIEIAVKEKLERDRLSSPDNKESQASEETVQPQGGLVG